MKYTYLLIMISVAFGMPSSMATQTINNSLYTKFVNPHSTYPVHSTYDYSEVSTNTKLSESTLSYTTEFYEEPTQSVAPSITPSGTQSITPSGTQSITPSGAPSLTQTVTPSITPSGTQSVTSSGTQTVSSSVTPSSTPSGTASLTPTTSGTQSVTPSETPCASQTYGSVDTGSTLASQSDSRTDSTPFSSGWYSTVSETINTPNDTTSEIFGTQSKFSYSHDNFCLCPCSSSSSSLDYQTWISYRESYLNSHSSSSKTKTGDKVNIYVSSADNGPIPFMFLVASLVIPAALVAVC